MDLSIVSQLKEDIRRESEGVDSAEALEQFRISFLGKKGRVQALMSHLKTLPLEEKKTFGKEVNHLKQLAEELLETKKKMITTHPVQEKTSFDETLPGIRPERGAAHILTQTVADICEIFKRMGFEICDGPEIETEFHNFTALNVPVDHSARESLDTFYTTKKEELLRTQTSTVQIRVMESRKPPLRIIAPGRVYRPDTVDASHSFMFHQIEGLMVDEVTTFSDLKGVLEAFLKEFFGPKTQIRLRPHFFPFTEPSVEVDVLWQGKKWLEILGAGFVDPAVLEAVRYDSKKVQGFAFGLGVERIAMLKYGIPDIRYFYENDIRFLKQFS